MYEADRGVREMIEKIHGEYSLTCDVCGDTVEGFEDFEDAVGYKRNNGWRSQKRGGQWEDVCPECVSWGVE